MKEIYHNSRASDGIDMKLGPVTKLDKRNKVTLRNFDDDVATINCAVIVILPIYGQFDSIWMLAIFFLTKNENRAKKPLIQLPHYCFEWR